MTRLLVFVAILFVGFGLHGCTPTPSTKASETTPDNSRENTEPTSEKTNDAGTSDSLPERRLQRPSADGYRFQLYTGSANAADVRKDRLCNESADPHGAKDKVQIQCKVEGGSFASSTPTAASGIWVWTWNLERGEQLQKQLALFKQPGKRPRPDILLLSEVDRGCARSGYRHVARDIAAALQMHYVYVTEFLEVSAVTKGKTPYSCEHGNAILSRFPLGNVRAFRHKNNHSWYSSGGGSTRLGGRITLAADIKVGSGYLHLYSVHLASYFKDHSRRRAQAAEILEDMRKQPHPIVIGGDFNAYLRSFDLQLGSREDKTIATFLQVGFQDSHASWLFKKRITLPKEGFVVDFLLGLDVTMSQPGLCSDDCKGLSDHYPIWTKVRVP